MVDKKEKRTCSGCSACEAVCPTHSIRMEKDEQSFYYPVIDHEKCIECGLCDKVCEDEVRTGGSISVPRAFGVYAADESLRADSSSGVVFSLFAGKILDEGGVVVGAAMSQDCYFVEHITVSDRESLAALRGSKYVQSRTGQKFIEIRNRLEEGQNVLFAGTPCQVNGLKAYLKKEYDNLFCIDFICHGVPSEGVWEKYCKETESRLGDKVTSVNFRHKKYGWAKFGAALGTENKGQIYRAKTEDPYLRLFLKNYCLRPYCYHCRHKGIVRKLDITIADFWGVRKVISGFSDGRGTSLILVQSEKGAAMLEEIRSGIRIEEVNTFKAADNNTAALEASYEPSDNNNFWNSLNSMTTEELTDRFTPVRPLERAKLAAAKTPFYKIVRKIRKS